MSAATVMKLDDYAKAINLSWRKTADGFLETAQLCAQAKAVMSKERLKDLSKKLEFSPSMLSKLIKIGEKKFLYEEPIRKQLPANYSIVYSLAKLDDTQLQKAADEKVISPKLTRERFKSWCHDQGIGLTDEEKAAEDEAKKNVVIASVQVPVDFSEERRLQLEADLERLRAKYGFNLELPEDPLEAEMHQIAKFMDSYIRREVKSYLATLKQMTLKAKKGLSEEERDRLWPHKAEELEIGRDAGWDDVRAVLKKVGKEEQFYVILNNARILAGTPEDRVRERRIADHNDQMAELKDLLTTLDRVSHNGRDRYSSEAFKNFK